MLKFGLALVGLLSSAMAQDSAECAGSFDIYFVCDISGSVGDGMATSGVDFMTDMAMGLWNSPSFRMSIIYWSSDAEVQLGLTGDHGEITNALTSLRAVQGSGGTYAHTGLQLALGMIEDELEVGAPMSLVFLLMDGVTSSESTAETVASQIKDLSAYIFGIAITSSSSVVDQFRLIASEPTEDFTSQVNSYDDLALQSNELITKFCLEVHEALTPASHTICHTDGVLETRAVTFLVGGRGFNASFLEDPVYKCAFDEFIVDATYISDTQLECTYPFHNETILEVNATYEAQYNYTLQVSVNGDSFVSSFATATINVGECADFIESGPGGGGQPLDSTTTSIIVVVALLLLLLLLWCLWPLLCGTAAAPAAMAVPKPIPAQSTKPSPEARKKKWATVDASNYIWASSGGGSAPLKTEWGKMGAVKSAPGAMVSEAVEMEAVSDSKPQKPPKKTKPQLSCWTRFCLCVHGCYSSCASLRPQRKSAKHFSAMRENAAQQDVP